VAESQYSCMVWYDPSVGEYVAMSPEWGAEAVGIGSSRAAALRGLEALVAHLDEARRRGEIAPAAHTPTTLAGAVEWMRDRLAAASVSGSAGGSPAAGQRRGALTPA
jgi:hypothetical protein